MAALVQQAALNRSLHQRLLKLLEDWGNWQFKCAPDTSCLVVHCIKVALPSKNSNHIAKVLLYDQKHGLKKASEATNLLAFIRLLLPMCRQQLGTELYSHCVVHGLSEDSEGQPRSLQLLKVLTTSNFAPSMTFEVVSTLLQLARRDVSSRDDIKVALNCMFKS